MRYSTSLALASLLTLHTLAAPLTISYVNVDGSDAPATSVEAPEPVTITKVITKEAPTQAPITVVDTVISTVTLIKEIKPTPAPTAKPKPSIVNNDATTAKSDDPVVIVKTIVLEPVALVPTSSASSTLPKSSVLGSPKHHKNATAPTTTSVPVALTTLATLVSTVALNTTSAALTPTASATTLATTTSCLETTSTTADATTTASSYDDGMWHTYYPYATVTTTVEATSTAAPPTWPTLGPSGYNSTRWS